MDKEDAVITAYRCHGWTYVMGAPVADVLSELTGTFSIFLEQLTKLLTIRNIPL